jgi:hypothetical protein
MPSKEIESAVRGDNYFSMYNLGRRGAQPRPSYFTIFVTTQCFQITYDGQQALINMIL